MIPQNQQEVLKKLSEKTQFLQNVTIRDSVNVNGFAVVIDSDGISYFTISGFVTVSTSETAQFAIRGIPTGLENAGDYPATNDVGTSGYVSVNKITDSNYVIMFNKGTAGRTIYFSVMLSQLLIDA